MEPIARMGVAQILIERILGLVAARQLRPGDRLPSERELAARFSVSRPTVREVVRALSVLGVVETRHGGGAFITSLDASALLGPLTFFLSLSDVNVEKLYEARRVIEGEICALAAGRIAPEDLEELGRLIELQDDERRDAGKYREIDSLFHRRLAEIADNPFYSRASQSLNILGLEFRKAASETEAVLSASIEDHRAILRALSEHDAEAARRAMAAHMDHVLTTTRAAMEAADVH